MGNPWRRTGIPALVVFLAYVLLVFSAAQTNTGNISLGGSGDLSLGYTARPPLEILWMLAHDVHPPLYYLLLHWWIELVGATPFAAKFPAIVLGTASVALLYALGSRFGGWLVGVVAAAFLAVSPMMSFYVTMVREWVGILFLVLLSSYSFLRLSGPPESEGRRSPSAKWLLGSWVGSTLAGLWTSYFSFSVLGAQMVMFLTGYKQRHLALGFGVIALGYLPWLFLFLGASGGPLVAYVTERSSGAPSMLPWDFLLDSLYRTTFGEYTHADTWVTFLVYGSLGGIASLGFSHARRGASGLYTRASTRRAILYAGTTVVFALVMAYLGSLGDAIVQVRFLMVPLPFFLWLLAQAIAWALAPRPRLAAVAWLLWLIPSVWATTAFLSTSPPPDEVWNPLEVARYLQQRPRPQDAIIFRSMGHAGYYVSAARDRLTWYPILRRGDAEFEPDLNEQINRILPQALARHPALWLVLYGGNTEQNQPVTRWLNEQAYPAEHQWLHRTLIYAYASPREGMTERPVGAAFREGLGLLGVRMTERAYPGGTVLLELSWRAQQRISEDYRVFVHLVDGQGQRRTQHDAEPQNGDRPTTTWQVAEVVADRHGLLLPPDLPPGEYWLEIGLYTPARRLELATGGTSLRVGPVTISP